MPSRKKILWIKSDPLHPYDVGGRIRTYNMLKELAKHHDVVYLALFPDNHDQTARQLASEYSLEQHWLDWSDPKFNKPRYAVDLLKNLFLSDLPYIVYKYDLPELKNAIVKLCKQHDFDLIVSDFLQLTSNLIKASEIYPPIKEIKTVMFQHNVENVIWRRHYENEKKWPLKLYFKSQWQRCLKYEEEASRWFDGVIAVSPDDARVFKDEMHLNNVIGSVSTGVDIDFFNPASRSPRPNSLVFLGAMDWMPNIEGVTRFVKETYPSIKKAIPEVTLTVVGRRPTPKVEQLAIDDPSIKVTGTVDDVRPYLNESQVALVPLNIGGGTRLKIFEMMAAKIPVVSTTIGAEGLPVTSGENIIIADGNRSFADRTIELLRNPNDCDQLAAKAFQFVSEHYSWATVGKEFEQMLFEGTASK